MSKYYKLTKMTYFFEGNKDDINLSHVFLCIIDKYLYFLFKFINYKYVLCA